MSPDQQEKIIPPSRRIDITEASRRLAKSDRTLRRWFHKGKLNAMLAEDGRLYFDSTEIDKLLAAAPHELPLTARLEALEKRVQELERLVEDLGTTGAQAIAPVITRVRPAPTAQEKSDLPADLIPASPFAAQHGIAESTFKKAIAAGRIAAQHGHWQYGRTIVTTALDATGRAQFYQLYQAWVDFIRCEDCPH
jgi:hypothetical protein